MSKAKPIDAMMQMSHCVDVRGLAAGADAAFMVRDDWQSSRGATSTLYVFVSIGQVDSLAQVAYEVVNLRLL